jgi:signal transduction histidine kinase
MDDIKLFGTLEPVESGESVQPIKILLAVCDPADRAIARASLIDTKLPLDIEETDSEEATLHALISRRYDCALVECVGRGTEQTVLDLLTRARSETLITPVVAITDRVAENTTEVLVAGALDYLIKDRITPFTLGQTILRAVQFARNKVTHGESRQQLLQARQQAIMARDAALEASQVKSQFLAYITHELKTPLNSIAGYANLIEDELADASMDHLTPNVQKIAEACKYLGELVSDLLDLSRLEAGKLPLDIIPVNVSDVASEASALVTPLIQGNGNTLCVQLSSDLPLIHTDRLRLCQILINLLSNAAKYTTGGTITLHAQCVEDSGEKMLKLTVEDTGVGIAPEEMPKLFEPYTQIKPSGEQKPAGTGLGLSLSRLLCWALKGDIHAESTPGKGSVFSVLLPVTMGDGKQA